MRLTEQCTGASDGAPRGAATDKSCSVPNSWHEAAREAMCTSTTLFDAATHVCCTLLPWTWQLKTRPRCAEETLCRVLNRLGVWTLKRADVCRRNDDVRLRSLPR